MKIYFLSSIGGKILAIVYLILSFLLLLLVIFLADEINLGYIIIPAAVFLFCLIGVYACFRSKIILTKKQVVLCLVYKLKNIIIDVNDIIAIDLVEEGLWMNYILFQLEKDSIKIPGFNGLCGIKSNLNGSKKLISNLKKDLNLT